MRNSIYIFKVKTIKGEEIELSNYKNKILLIVNTASKCGFTPQYEGLETLYKKYKDKNFIILGFPCNQFLFQEPGNETEIEEFCKINYGVTFPMFSKIKVKGKEIHDLYKFLTKEQPNKNLQGTIKWNFTKFLVNAEGEVINRYEPKITPENIESDIIDLIKNYE